MLLVSTDLVVDWKIRDDWKFDQIRIDEYALKFARIQISPTREFGVR